MESGNPKLPNSDDSEAAVTPAEPTAVAAAKAESRIVVLAKREAGVRSTVNFLERRGFAAKYASSLNEAVEMFSKKEADKLLLSVNYPHPKVEMLPVLMNQSFQIETILFAEETDRKTSNRLSNAKTKHVLFGPVSGPVVMMKIRQIDRELSGEVDEASATGEKRTLSSKEDEGDIKIGGRKGSNDDTVVLNGKTERGTQATLDNLMKSLSDEGDESDSSPNALARSGDTYIQKGDRSKMKSAGGDEDAEENGTLSERAQDLRAALDQGLTAAPDSGGRKRLIAPNSFKRAATNADSIPLAPAEEESLSPYEKAAQDLRAAEQSKLAEAAKARAEREATEASKKAERDAQAAKQKSEREELAAKQRAEREATAAKMKLEREAAAIKAKADRETAASEKKAEREAADVEAKAAAAKSQEAVAARAREERALASKAKAEETERASAKRADAASREPAVKDPVDQLVAVLSDAEKIPLTFEQKIRRCLHESLAIVAGAPKSELNQLVTHAQAALISLRSPQINCAFVVSMNYAKQTANELFHRMEVAFFSLLRDHGVEFENNDTYSIFLDNMNIVRDAFAGSDFAVITQTSDIEMGAAQVYISDPVAKTDLYEGDMHSINLRDLPLDEPVTFNLFLHFKRNRKYLRYLKIGSTISDRQIHRLERHNVTGLVDHTEVEAFQRTFAAHSIVSLKKPAA